ncbi:MAG: lipoyl synthase [Candidatus Thiodiazotropha sp. (ex. Lucinisca nassula)]|nr:lipoyl synthase [Candidatus Thiodiazotropha sp. (ex. Lucinisca nassula)]MBW9261615.1 lipoyl synthase [Candidatus Thiodiazotropha sp. (ex. Lucinisca nassula)]MBW9270495.1 lipoyl synthase [Candidatus Thiodiazotropha sp. (ex. Lucinisca nassula)]
MSSNKELLPPSRTKPESHQRGKSKLSRIPVKVESDQPPLRKPKWIRAKAPLGKEVSRIRRILRDKGLSSVCEEAACPNLGECFQHGTATFMIMGDICTRRCPFCDVAHGKPQPLDPKEPQHLADAIASMALKYVVITSVDRDDLRDGGGNHFAQCVAAIRQKMPKTSVELLVPDFRGRVEQALTPLMEFPPDVFNHNLETVPRLYRQARPGADYQGSLELLKRFKQHQPRVPTKSGLMLGLGERKAEILAVMQDLRDHDCEMLTLGQYLQPSHDHLPVDRFVTPEEFDDLAKQAEAMGFTSVASGPMVRSSYHADLQANPLLESELSN